jgi:serine protease Do
MKTKNVSSITVGLAFTLITTATSIFAIEVPEDDAPPPPSLKQKFKDLPEIKLESAPKPMAKTQANSAFLGIISANVPEMLMSHLNLNPGEGIVVRSLVPNGPAANAGIQVNDVITKVAGQPVGSPIEITHQIAAHQPGNSITFELIHKGKLTTVNVTLGTRPSEMASADLQPLGQEDIDDLPQELADRVRGAIAGNIGGMSFQLGGMADQDLERMQEAAKNLLQQKLKAKIHGITLPDLPHDGKQQPQSSSTIKMMDDEGSIEVKSTDETKEVIIRDPQGEITWNGPWNNEQNKVAAPATIRQRVESLLLNGSGLGMQMRQNIPRISNE